MKTALAIVSADITDATSDGLANDEKLLKTAGGGLTIGQLTLGSVASNGQLIVKTDGFDCSIYAGSLTQNVEILFPDASGTVALTSDIPDVPPMETKSANFTAENDGEYTATATLTVTDPTPSEGASFRVLVRNGTATVGGTAYSVAGTVIERVFHSGAWVNYPYSSALFGAGVATFLATPSSANLAAAVTDETGTGSLVFGTSPTLTTPTISRGSAGQVFTAQDNNGVVTTMTTDALGRNFLQINGKTGAASQAGAYITASGFEEAWAYVNCLSNTSGQRVMRFGNLSNRFSIQRLNDTNTSITATPFSIANDAPTNSFYLTTAGNTGFGTATPSSKAILDLTSTTLGFLPPRMTTVQRDAITSVPAGLMIYNTTTNKLNVYTTAWEAITSA
jgi:hypothetical protein